MASARRAGRRAGSFKGVIDLHVKLSLCLGAALAALATPAFALTDDARKPAEDGEIVVSGRYTLPDKIDTATGLGLTVRETPQSVSIVTAQRILDQNLISIADVIQNGVGVTVNEVDDVRNSFYARGFEIRNTQLDGVPTNWTLAGSAGETNIDVSIFERVEIVRGATGLLSGAGGPPLRSTWSANMPMRATGAARPTPAMAAGTPGASRAMSAARHRGRARPRPRGGPL